MVGEWPFVVDCHSCPVIGIILIWSSSFVVAVSFSRSIVWFCSIKNNFEVGMFSTRHASRPTGRVSTVGSLLNILEFPNFNPSWISCRGFISLLPKLHRDPLVLLMAVPHTPNTRRLL